MITKRAVLGAVAGLALVGGLSGCSKNVDIQTTGAEKVPGTSNLYRFCDGPTQIYFSQYSGSSDEYEFIVYDGCNPQGTPRPQSLPDDE